MSQPASAQIVTNGVLVIDKPRLWSSHKVVSVLRHVFHQKKIGHAGTLDPQASGVLVMLLGSATKISDHLMAQNKTYEVTVQWGLTTTTYDLEGEVVEKNDNTLLEEEVQKILPHFLGKQKQIPPMYSAIKVEGKKLYELAREGKVLEREPRDIEVFSLSLLEFKFPFSKFRVTCSKGTYIRSLIHDLGQRLKVGATCDHIRRTQSGDFKIEEAAVLTLETQKETLMPFVRSTAQVLSQMEHIEVSQAQEKKLRQGQSVKMAELLDNPLCLVKNISGQEVCLGKVHGGVLHPQKEL